MRNFITLQFKYKRGKKSFGFRYRKFGSFFLSPFSKLIYKSIKPFFNNNKRQQDYLISNSFIIPQSTIPLNVLYNISLTSLESSSLGNKLQTTLIRAQEKKDALYVNENTLNPIVSHINKRTFNSQSLDYLKVNEAVSQITDKILLLQKDIQRITQGRFLFQHIFESIMAKDSHVRTIFLTFFKTKKFLHKKKLLFILLFYLSKNKNLSLLKYLLKSQPTRRSIILQFYNHLLLKKHKINIRYKNILDSIVVFFTEVSNKLFKTEKSLFRLLKQKSNLQRFSKDERKEKRSKQLVSRRLDHLSSCSLNYNTKINFNHLFLNYILYTRSKLISLTTIKGLSTIQQNNSRFRHLQHVFQPLHILFSFVKNKFFLVNLINPLLNINLFSGHPSLTRNKIFEIAKHNFKKYSFLLSMKKKKALKNPFMRSLTILSASLRLYKLIENTPYSISFLLNIPRHLLNKTLLFSIFSFFIIQEQKTKNVQVCKVSGTARDWWKYKNIGFKLIFKYPGIICKTLANTRMPFFLLFLIFLLKYLRGLFLRQITTKGTDLLMQRILNTRNTIKFILIYRLSLFFVARSSLSEREAIEDSDGVVGQLLTNFTKRIIFFSSPKTLTFHKAQRNVNIDSLLFNFTQSHCGLTKIKKNKR